MIGPWSSPRCAYRTALPCCADLLLKAGHRQIKDQPGSEIAGKWHFRIRGSFLPVRARSPHTSVFPALRWRKSDIWPLPHALSPGQVHQWARASRRLGWCRSRGTRLWYALHSIPSGAVPWLPPHPCQAAATEVETPVPPAQNCQIHTKKCSVCSPI